MPLDTELGLDLPLEDRSHEALLNILRTANVLSAIGATLFRPFGITEAQFNALLTLKYKKGNLTQSDLGKRLVITRASVTSVLDKLEDKHLVSREAVAGDRRVYHVELTQQGRDLLDQVEPVYRRTFHRVIDRLAEKEKTQLIRILERVRSCAGSVEADASA